jgi:hypothetical protein
LSDASIDPQAAIAKDGSVAELVDYVDRDVRYRSFKADWLRVLPGDDEDEEAREQCERYTIAIAPATRVSETKTHQHHCWCAHPSRSPSITELPVRFWLGPWALIGWRRVLAVG